MGVWLVRFFRTILPFFLTLFALLSATFVVMGGVRRDPFLNKNYVFKIDARNISAYKAPPRDASATHAENIGLSNYYYFSLWGHCHSKYGLKGLTCTDPKIDYYFNPKSILRSQLKKNVIVRLPSGTEVFAKRVRIASLCMIILYLVGLLFTLLTLFSIFVITISGTGLLFASLISGYAAFSLISASSTLTILYYFVKTLIRDKAGYLRLKTSYGKYALFYTWFSSSIILVVFISLLLATRFDRKKKTEAAKLYQ